MFVWLPEALNLIRPHGDATQTLHSPSPRPLLAVPLSPQRCTFEKVLITTPDRQDEELAEQNSPSLHWTGSTILWTEPAIPDLARHPSLMTEIITRKPLEALGMASAQHNTRRRMSGIVDNDEDAPPAKKPRVEESSKPATRQTNGRKAATANAAELGTDTFASRDKSAVGIFLRAF